MEVNLLIYSRITNVATIFSGIDANHAKALAKIFTFGTDYLATFASVDTDMKSMMNDLLSVQYQVINPTEDSSGFTILDRQPH